MRAINFLFIITILNYFNEKNDPFLKDGDHTDFHGLMYQGPYDWNNSIYGNPDANTDGNLLGDGLKNENNYVLLNAGANPNDAKDALEALEELVDYLLDRADVIKNEIYENYEIFKEELEDLKYLGTWHSENGDTFPVFSEPK